MNGVGAVALEESDEFVCAALCGDSDSETCEVVPWLGAHSTTIAASVGDRSENTGTRRYPSRRVVGRRYSDYAVSVA